MIVERISDKLSDWLGEKNFLRNMHRVGLAAGVLIFACAGASIASEVHQTPTGVMFGFAALYGIIIPLYSMLSLERKEAVAVLEDRVRTLEVQLGQLLNPAFTHK